MKLAELGARLKLIYPEYKTITDAELGAKFQAKYPGFFEQDDEPPMRTENSRLMAKLSDLQSGALRVVFIPRGTKDKVNAADLGMKRVTLPSGDYVYNPKVIRPQEIMAAIRDHNTEDLLAPVAIDQDQEELPSEPMPQGIELQEAINAAGDVGTAEPVTIPKVDIQNRVAAVTRRRGDKWPKPGSGVKLPPGEM